LSEMQIGRIVSFLPSSTEILYEIGAGDLITGVTHECNHPPDAKNKRRVINSSIDARNLSSREIDGKIAGLMRAGENIYAIDDHQLIKSKPDLIIAQGICEVCAPFAKEIDRANIILGYEPEVLVLHPHDLDDILASIMEIAEKVGRTNEGYKLVRSLQKRIDNIKKIVAERRSNNSTKDPKIVCIEWIDPFFSAGHWIPQMVGIAGGTNGLSMTRQPSRRISIEEVIKFNPDKIILMPCGFDVARILNEVKTLRDNNKWRSLRAVQEDQVYAVNANAYFSKPGPRTIIGLEILSKIINPSGFENIELPPNSYAKVEKDG
jgi:iron complex transport system substrate-binding protein